MATGQEEAPRSSSLALVIGSPSIERVLQDVVARLVPKSSSAGHGESAVESSSTDTASTSEVELLQLGIAALDAFLQANVTGPVLPPDSVAAAERLITSAGISLGALRKACLKDLEVDGVSPYAYIPHLELFCLARHVIDTSLPGTNASGDVVEVPSVSSSEETTKHSISWTRLRVNAWHYKLLTQPTLGSGSNFTRSSQWSDVPTLAARIFDGIDAVTKQVLDEDVWAAGDNAWSKEDKVTFLVEAANYYILLGRNDLARDLIDKAAQTSGLQYTLSGALGKRTKFQEKSTSQLVVLAKSSNDESKGSATNGNEAKDAKPDALKLNDDTLLEDIHFIKDADGSEPPAETKVPNALAELSPDNQPQLSPLDQIILLTEATMKDAFSPVDTLTSEEILPYAVRVLADKSTNWQIYTQALLVRSRIELHRSRTLERGVLQLQAVADQVLADTTAEAASKPESSQGETGDVPSIQVTQPDQQSSTTVDKPTSFLPAPKPSESAPAHVRLQYIHALSSPPRWHLESELAHAWAGVGSLASALDIFKRLRLWPEVALCLASRAAAEEGDGRGGGGEEKARGIIRWRLFHRTDTTSPTDPDDEVIDGDVADLRGADFTGPERDPPPPNAPRLWCILGDIETEASHYERAWEISNHRYSRAQRSLGEHYVQQRKWEEARDAYKKATAVNRLNPDMWGRLGDISLRLANFEEAAEAYSRSIGSATDVSGGEGAKTWSNLGSALWSLYCEIVASENDKDKKEDDPPPATARSNGAADDEDDSFALEKSSIPSEPSKLLAQALSAYKKGATIAHDNWRIWDNVLTLSARMRPASVPDMVLALKHVLRIRQTEDAVDVDVLSALLQDVVLSQEKDPNAAINDGIYEPPRGTMERLVTRLVEEDIVPIITYRSDLWTLVARLRAWRRDYAGAIEASERAWRAAMGSSSASSTGLLPGSSSSSSADWTSDKTAWEVVVQRTDELASMLENWGPDVKEIGPKWKGRVRSAVRSVLGRGRESWEGTEGWKILENIMEGLKS